MVLAMQVYPCNTSFLKLLINSKQRKKKTIKHKQKKNNYKAYRKHIAGICKSDINFLGQVPQVTMIKSNETKFEASPYLWLVKTLAILT